MWQEAYQVWICPWTLRIFCRDSSKTVWQNHVWTYKERKDETIKCPETWYGYDHFHLLYPYQIYTLWQKIFNLHKNLKWSVPRIHPTVDDRIVHRVAHSQPVNDVINVLHVFPVVDLRFGGCQHEVEMVRQPAHRKRDHHHYHHLHYLLTVKPIHSVHNNVVS